MKKIALFILLVIASTCFADEPSFYFETESGMFYIGVDSATWDSSGVETEDCDCEKITEHVIYGDIVNSSIELKNPDGKSKVVVKSDGVKIGNSDFKNVPLEIQGDNVEVFNSSFIDEGIKSSESEDIVVFGTTFTSEGNMIYNNIMSSDETVQIAGIVIDGKTYNIEDLVFKPDIKELIKKEVEEMYLSTTIFTPYNVLMIAIIAIISVVIYNRVIVPRMTFKWVIMKFFKMIYKPFQKAKSEAQEGWEEAKKE